MERYNKCLEVTKQGHSVDSVNLDFSVATTGVIQVKEHAGRLKHINKLRQYSEKKNFFWETSSNFTQYKVPGVKTRDRDRGRHVEPLILRCRGATPL